MGKIKSFLDNKGNRDTIKLGVGASLVLLSMYLLQRYVLHDMIGNVIIENSKYYCTLIWICFAMFSSKLEAYYYSHEINSNRVDNFNEHPLFNLIRLCVWIPLWIISGWKVALCLGVMFPFFHDGNYYRWRNIITPRLYAKKWLDQSTTSTAMSTKYMTPVVRTSLAIISLIALIFWA